MRKAWNKKLPDYWTCDQCKNKFKNITGHVRKFCSRECYVLAQKEGKYPQGRYLSKEKHWHWNGGKPKCVDCGKIIGYGRKLKICRDCFHIWERGENGPNWQGGLTKQNYPYQFRKIRETVRCRDGYKCGLCGLSQGKLSHKLSVHHINYIKKDINLKNLISLCASCHGQTNHNRRFWMEYFGSQN